MAKQYSNSDKDKHVKEALRQKDSLEGTITAYAKAQGIPHTTLHQWIKKYTAECWKWQEVLHP